MCIQGILPLFSAYQIHGHGHVVFDIKMLASEESEEK